MIKGKVCPHFCAAALEKAAETSASEKLEGLVDTKPVPVLYPAQSPALRGQRYSFTIRPRDEYKRLINIIKTINPFDPKGETELESFFADNRDAILATEAGAIPDELDYRN